jgi:uncharacterized peroxidase-related enzyme
MSHSRVQAPGRTRVAEEHFQLFHDSRRKGAGRRGEHPDVASGGAAELKPPATARACAHADPPSTNDVPEDALHVAHHPGNDTLVGHIVDDDGDLLRLAEFEDAGHRPQCTSYTGLMDTISRFPIPDLDALPGDIRSRIVAIQEKSGFIPNVFLAWAHRPDEFRAFFAYHDALLEKQGGLSKAEREMIVVATSALNQCHYCVIAHGAILRIRAKQPLLADQVAVNYLNAELTARQRGMLDFAVKVAARSHEVGDADFAKLHALGITDEDIWDIGAITALFALSNRMANLMALRPNDEFYLMGRVPAAKPA